MFPPLGLKGAALAWNGSGGAADAPRSGERRRAAGCGAKPRQVPSARAKGPLRGALAALAVVLGAGLAWWLVSRPASTEPAPEPAHGKPAAKPSAPKPAKAGTTNAQAKAEKPAKPEPPPFQKRPGAMQLPDGRVLTFRPPKEGEFRIVHSHGSTYKCDHLGNWEDITPKPIFDNTFEETLVGLATTGNFIPGMLMGIDYDDAIKMLTKPVVVNPDDPEDVVAKKEAVAAAKEAILDYMKDGASLDDFVMEMRKQVVKERFIRGMALKEIVASLKEGRAQDAADMRDAANKMLENDNLRPMNLPAHIEQAIEENK